MLLQQHTVVNVTTRKIISINIPFILCLYILYPLTSCSLPKYSFFVSGSIDKTTNKYKFSLLNNPGDKESLDSEVAVKLFKSGTKNRRGTQNGKMTVIALDISNYKMLCISPQQWVQSKGFEIFQHQHYPKIL